jgi:CheY-like chemotaxis protein
MSRDDNPTGHDPLVLIVDDEDALSDVLAELLALHRFRTMRARDGAEALRLLRSVRPDVVLLDLMMPVMNGLETLEAMRSDPSTAHLPVIVSSASIRGNEKIAGADLVLRKPFDFDEMLSAVRRLARAPEIRVRSSNAPGAAA